MKPKTVTLWNVPLFIARDTVQNMRTYVAKCVEKGASIEEIQTLLYQLENCEDELRKAEQEDQDDE